MTRSTIETLNHELNHLRAQLGTYHSTLQKSLETRKRESTKDTDLEQSAQSRLTDRIAQIEFLISVPAFQRITLTWTDEEEPSVIWIAKFGYIPLNIYSWATPIGKLRFESPGHFEIATPNGLRTGIIHEKLVFQIANNSIIFLSHQTASGTELIHQEHFANHEFALKEVVSRLESYQDEIISTDYRTPLQITGPAGSGKTTLGFHRLAYLHQNSSVCEVFDTARSLALINDESTKEYFMSVLRPLNMGHQVQVVTPTEWMTSILNLPKGITVINDYTTNEMNTLWYYWEKGRATLPKIPYEKLQPFAYLTQVYAHLPRVLQTKWTNQNKSKQLDRYDLSLLMRAHQREHGHVLYQKPVRVQTRKFGSVIQYFPEQLQYASILTDEFQNYTEHEHTLIQSCIHPSTNTLMFVGDPNQQTLPGTAIHTPNTTKHIHIDKTYRNSSAILSYLAEKGYNVPASSGSLQSGSVTEHTTTPNTLEVDAVTIATNMRSLYPNESIGIIVFEETIANNLRRRIPSTQQIFIGTSYGVQGVEFEHAIVVAPNQTTTTPSPLLAVTSVQILYPPEFLTEYQRIMRDRIYVALTRAINTLNVLRLDLGNSTT